jgi:hypothetical protein
MNLFLDTLLKVQTGGVPIQDKKYEVNDVASTGYFTSFGDMISNILNIVLTIGVIAVLLYLIMGGIEWITSGGDKGKTESARNKITAAVIGLVILISAWAIMLFVQQLLGIKVFGGAAS